MHVKLEYDRRSKFSRHSKKLQMKDGEKKAEIFITNARVKPKNKENLSVSVHAQKSHRCAEGQGFAPEHTLLRM